MPYSLIASEEKAIERNVATIFQKFSWHGRWKG